VPPDGGISLGQSHYIAGGYQLSRLVPNRDIYAGRGIAHLKEYNLDLKLFESMWEMKKFNHLKVPHLAVFLRHGGHAHFQDDKDHIDVLQARLDVH